MTLDPFPLEQPLTLWIDARPVSAGRLRRRGLAASLDGCTLSPAGV
jgi:hypothetical protein